MVKAKNVYRSFCLSEPRIPIFSKDWWLDAVCGDDWDVSLVERGGRVVAAMPYHYWTNRLGMKIISQPQETPSLGPWIVSSNAKNAVRIGHEKNLLSELIDQLPSFSQFNQNWNHTYNNWLPFYWHGFKQTTRYTYRLPDLSDLDQIWAGFASNIRKEIRKAKNRFEISVRTDLSIDDLLTLNKKTFKRQGLALPYSENLIKRIDFACSKHNSRAIFIAVDSDGKHHAGAYLVWDSENAYYLFGGGDPELRSSGATSLCIWEAIQFANSVTCCFDFEGSMIESVERFFRAFGAVQTPYFSISKTPSRLLRIRNCLKTIFA